MDTANRLGIVIAALLLIFVMAVIILLTWLAAPETVDRLGDFVQYLDNHTETGAKLLLTLGLLVLVLLALTLIIAELAPAQAARVQILDVRGGTAVLSTDDIAQRVKEEVEVLPHVLQAKATVQARGKGVEVEMELHVDPESNLADTSDQACRVVQTMLSDKMSVALQRPPRVQVRYEELRLARGGGESGAAPPASETEGSAGGHVPPREDAPGATLEGVQPPAPPAGERGEGEEAR
jgi:hypothetical protein